MTLLDMAILVHLLATVYMAGVIWFVQVVHYPMFSGFSEFSEFAGTEFRSCAIRHQRLTARVVLLPMVIEITTGIWLAIAHHNSATAMWWWIALALIGVIWWSTFAIQVPLHQTLARGFQPAAHQRLVTSNWVRTVAWSVRAVLVGVLVCSASAV
jgi:hypothetical protein